VLAEKSPPPAEWFRDGPANRGSGARGLRIGRSRRGAYSGLSARGPEGAPARRPPGASGGRLLARDRPRWGSAGAGGGRLSPRRRPGTAAPGAADRRARGSGASSSAPGQPPVSTGPERLPCSLRVKPRSGAPQRHRCSRHRPGGLNAYERCSPSRTEAHNPMGDDHPDQERRGWSRASLLNAWRGRAARPDCDRPHDACHRERRDDLIEASVDHRDGVP
jgi:hypothetical protein